MQKTVLPPQYVTGTVGKLLGIELHPDEPKISNRQSVREAGCVILKYMPKWLYLEIPDTADGFLKSDNADAPQLGSNVIAIEPDLDPPHERRSQNRCHTEADPFAAR